MEDHAILSERLEDQLKAVEWATDVLLIINNICFNKS